jgi:hypothetical protein
MHRNIDNFLSLKEKLFCNYDFGNRRNAVCNDSKQQKTYPQNAVCIFSLKREPKSVKTKDIKKLVGKVIKRHSDTLQIGTEIITI